jgi:hypothetical protein
MTLCPRALGTCTRLSIFGNNVFTILQMEQRPNVFASAHNYVPTSAAITAIRPAFGYKLLTAEVTTATTALSGAAANLYVIDKIGFSHKDV